MAGDFDGLYRRYGGAVLGDRVDAGGRSQAAIDTVLEGSPAERAGLHAGEGVLVRTVVPGSPAARAGLLRGDVITWGAGSPITDLEELQAAIAAAGKTLSLHAFRAGEWSSFALAMPRHPTPR